MLVFHISWSHYFNAWECRRFRKGRIILFLSRKWKIPCSDILAQTQVFPIMSSSKIKEKERKKIRSIDGKTPMIANSC